jgi:hypothetical protein
MFAPKSYTFRLSPGQAERLNAALPGLGGNDATGMREILDLLLHRISAPPQEPPAPTETPEYLQQQTVLAEVREQAAKIQADYDALAMQHNELLKSHDATHEALQQRAEAAETALQATQLPDNAIVLEPDGATSVMLSETCECLREAAQHYPQLADFAGVTPGVLLVSMFRRYVKERRTEWFFPLAVLPPERINELEQSTA